MAEATLFRLASGIMMTGLFEPSSIVTFLMPAVRQIWSPISRLPVNVTLRTRRSEEHTSELQSQSNLVCRLLLEKKKTLQYRHLRHQHAPFAHPALSGGPSTLRRFERRCALPGSGTTWASAAQPSSRFTDCRASL